MKTDLSLSNQTRYTEILAVLFTGIGKFVFMDWLDWKLFFISVAVVFWSAYIGLRRSKFSDISHYWGFRKDNFKKTFKLVLPFGLAAVISCVLIGWLQGTLNITWHIIPILVIYPIWGVIQQFLIIGLVAGNLSDLDDMAIPKWGIIISTAIIFGVLHYPFYWLILGIFLLALFYSHIYLKERNVYVLGLFHGWLGAVFFYTVLGRDPFIEVFGKYLTI